MPPKELDRSVEAEQQEPPKDLIYDPDRWAQWLLDHHYVNQEVHDSLVKSDTWRDAVSRDTSSQQTGS